jgi:hypothetical protein
MAEEFTEVFEQVAFALQRDADDDVTVDGRRLLVKGHVFAAFEGGRLVVDLPAARTDDLVARGIATAVDRDGAARGAWASVVDQEDWLELASEAHQFVGEPAVGRDS